MIISKFGGRWRSTRQGGLRLTREGASDEPPLQQRFLTRQVAGALEAVEARGGQVSLPGPAGAADFGVIISPGLRRPAQARVAPGPGRSGRMLCPPSQTRRVLCGFAVAESPASRAGRTVTVGQLRDSPANLCGD